MKMYSEYRAQARETLKGRWNKMAGVLFVFVLISSMFSVPTVIGAVSQLEWLTLSGNCGNYLFTWLVLIPLDFAFYNVCLSLARREEVPGIFSALFDDFADRWGKYVLAGLLITVLALLVGIPTLMIGAVILGLAYGLVPFVLRDNKEMGVREALKTSRLMMRGHKWQLFILELTFIGWILLCTLTLFIGLIWVAPYMTVTLAHFYEDVKAEYEAKQANS